MTYTRLLFTFAPSDAALTDHHSVNTSYLLSDGDLVRDYEAITSNESSVVGLNLVLRRKGFEFLFFDNFFYEDESFYERFNPLLVGHRFTAFF